MLYHVDVDSVPRESLAAAREALARLLDHRPPDLGPAASGKTVRAVRELPLFRAEQVFAELARLGAQVRLVPIPVPEDATATADPLTFRPLRARERIGWALRTFRRCWPALLGALALSIVAGTLMQLLAAALLGVAGFASAVDAPPLRRAAGALAAACAVALFTAGTLLPQAVLFRLPSAFLERGRRAGALRVVREALGRTPDLTAASLALLLLIAAPPALLVWLGPPWLLLAPLLLLLLVPLALSFLLAGPVIVHEEIGPLAALRRSFRLLAGRRLALVAELSLVSLGTAAGVGLSLAPILIVGALAGPLAAGVLAAADAPILLALMLAALFTGSFLLDALYFEARIERDRWAPAWIAAPDPSWPTSSLARRGPRRSRVEAWGGALLISLAVALPLMLGAPRVIPEGTLALADPALLVPEEARARVIELLGERAAAMLPAEGAAGGDAAPAVAAPAGAALVRVGPVLDARGDDPKLAVSVQLDLGAAAEAAASGVSPLRIDVAHVTGRDGRELYAAAHRFEAPRHRRAALERLPSAGPAEFRGWRNVHLLPGTALADIARVEGTIVLEPLRPEAVPRFAHFTVVPGATVSALLEAGAAPAPEGDVVPLPDGALALADDPAALARGAHALVGRGRYQDAITLLDRLIAIEPENAWALYTRGWVNWKLGERGAARRDVERACDLGYEEACRLARSSG